MDLALESTELLCRVSLITRNGWISRRDPYPMITTVRNSFGG